MELHSKDGFGQEVKMGLVISSSSVRDVAALVKSVKKPMAIHMQSSCCGYGGQGGDRAASCVSGDISRNTSFRRMTGWGTRARKHAAVHKSLATCKSHPQLPAQLVRFALGAVSIHQGTQVVNVAPTVCGHWWLALALCQQVATACGHRLSAAPPWWLSAVC